MSILITTDILTSVKLDVTGQRWVASLANYNFRIFYKTGKTNVEVDALSHIPRPKYQVIDTAAVKAIIDVVPRTDLTEYNYHPTDIVCKSTQIVVHKKSRDDWKTEQENDSIIGPVIQAMGSKNCDSTQMNDESR